MISFKEAKEKSWIPTNNRFVVFMDIMGFKDFVARNPHKEVYNMMSKLSISKEVVDMTLSDSDLDKKYRNKELYTTSFSDSLILFSKDDSPISLEMIAVATSFILAQAMEDTIPMKGAIAHGLISVNKAKQIYFGQPIIDAYLLQDELNYYGIISHNSVDQYLNNRSNEITEDTKNSFVEIKTPLKTGKILHYNINWFSAFNSTHGKFTNLETYFDRVIKELKSITSGEPRKYIDNTVDVYELITKTATNK